MLRALVSELRSLVSDEPTSDDGDPLESLVGLPDADSVKPTDPVLQRLLPDGYGEPDDAAEFRRYTESELRATKRSAADTVLATVPERGGNVVLDDDEAQVWLAALNDVRLALGTRLDVTEDTFQTVRPDDPRLPELAIYDWLTMLQESLVQVVAGW